jgi:protein-disulfide isomerase
VRFVYRDFALPNHPEAQPAAEAALCAHEQGKFWPFHDRIFENQRALSSESYRRFAADLGLDQKAFGECVDSRKYRGTVEKDYREGESIGVNATPTFFINGRFLSGAQPFEQFQSIIDDEISN